MGRAKSKEITRAEQEAQRDFAAARGRVEAQGLETRAKIAWTLAVETSRLRLELESELVQAYREGRAARWPRIAELQAATKRDDIAHAAAVAATDRQISEMNGAAPALWRVLCLKAGAHDTTREAQGRGGKKAAGTKASRTAETAQKVARAARQYGTKSEVAKVLGMSRNTAKKYWPHP